MKITITGAAGKLGSITTRLLASLGHQVRAVDRAERSPLPVPLMVVDLLDAQATEVALRDTEVLVHVANHPNAHPKLGVRVHHENVVMNLNTLEAARLAGVGRVIAISSVQTIAGDHRPPQSRLPSQLPYLPLDGQVPVNPGNLYALSKVILEDQLRYYTRQWAMNCVAVRFPFLLPEQQVEDLRRNRPTMASFGAMEEAFAYLPFEQAAELLAALVQADLPGYRCYFAAAPDPLVSDPIAELVRRCYAHVPLRRPLQELTSLVDLSAIEQETGWRPRSIFT